MTAAADPRDPQRQLEELTGLLGRERALLTEGRIDGEALATLAAEKQERLAALAEFERDRRDASGPAALPPALLERAREAARLNRFNGQLIAARMMSNRRMLNDLGNLGGNDLYGPDGEASGQHARLASQA